jgi:serine/threonine protein kinase
MRKPELGQIVGGKYQLLCELGRGGMATVFEAENTLTLKRAAVKWLHPQYHDEGQGLQRVIREARAASRIRHENVVDVYDVVEEGSSVYLVMELLHGELLSTLLDREDLPVHELVALLVPAMRGVLAAHAAGVVHRDIKPDNIFLARESEQERPVPKVIDFGISKVTEADPSNQTRTGVTMGTPRYASYEQLLGARSVDARTDVYAFGVILYEALTGHSPYGDALTFAEQAVRFATREVLPARALRADVPAALDVLVQRAIAKHREDRTASLEALLLELVPFADPGRYPQPMRVRSQAALRNRATLPEGRAPHASAPPLVRRDPSRLVSVPGPERHETRRRGLALTAIGVGTMAFALLSMRFESPPRSRARMPDEAWDAGSPRTLVEPAPVAPPSPPEPQPLAPPPVVKKPRRADWVVKKATTPTSEAPAPVVDSLHRAGPLRRSEF